MNNPHSSHPRKALKHSVGFSGPLPSESTITVVPNGETADLFNVYIGFLKVHHKYAIQFALPNPHGLQKLSCSSAPGVGLNIKDVKCTKEGIGVNLEYTCEFKEGVVTENFVLSDSSRLNIQVILHIEVLRKDQGTPSLKSGVKCIEHLHADESEYSDWPGF